MNEKDWGTFVVTGRVADYLNYKNGWDVTRGPGRRQELQEDKTGAKKHESDRSDRDGAGGSADR